MTKTKLFSDPQQLPCANVHWREGDPIAEDFDDVYGSTDDAMAEKSHVFIQPNDLPTRFAQLGAGEHVSVLELGFGSGLNFLLTWQLWRQQRQQQPDARLVYTSLEGFPMALEDLQRCQQQWSELGELARQLQQQYPLPIKGFHRLEFDQVTLNLLFGDVEECLGQLDGQVDAVYLDGFNPAKNTAMWQSAVMQYIAQLSHPGTTIATYSAARLVKDNLKQVGFEVKTASGYGLKRNQLGGIYRPQQPGSGYQSPWHQAPESLPVGSRIAVVGAGISGCSTALALQQRGFEVQLIDQGQGAAHGASGNQQGMLYAKLPDSVTVAGQLHQQGLQYSMGLLQRSLDEDLWDACGLLQLAQNDKEAAQMVRVMDRQFPRQWLQGVTQQQASDIAAHQVANGGLWFPQAGWVSPVSWCQHLSTQLRQPAWFNTRVDSIHCEQGQWQLNLNGKHSGSDVFDGLVLCNASQAKNLVPELDLPLKAIRGQVSYVQQAQGCDAVVCGQGYVTPASAAGTMAVGASYNLGSDNPHIDEQDHVANLQRLQQLLPDAETSLQQVHGGRVGFRATSPDYMPLVGQLADANGMLERFAHLRKDKNFRFQESMPWQQGLYINAGHGSKGLITAPLCGQLLAAQIAGEVLPLSRYVAQALSPSRFFLRDMMRRKR